MDQRSNRLRIILAFSVFGLVFAGYTVLWRHAASVMRSELSAFAAAETAAGRPLTYDTLSVAGYPFGLRGQLDQVSWSAGPDTRFEAQTVLLAAVPFDPGRVVLSPRGEQMLTIGEQRYDVSADDLRFNLERGSLAFEGHGVTVENDQRKVTVRDMIGNQRTDGLAQTYRLAVKWMTIGQEGQIVFPALDISVERQDTDYKLAYLAMTVQDQGAEEMTQLFVDGALTLTPGEKPSGQLGITVKNEAPFIRLAAEAFGLDAAAAESITQFTGSMTSQGEEEISLPIIIDKGQVVVGFLPIGELPTVPLR